MIAKTIRVKSGAKRAVVALLCTAALLAAGFSGVRFAKAESAGTGEKYALNFQSMAANEIGGISYDVIFDFQNVPAPFFTNAVPSSGTLVLEADTVESVYRNIDGQYALTRAKQIDRAYTIYDSDGGNANLYTRGDGAAMTNEVNIFQDGEHTSVVYTPGQGPSVTVGGEAYDVGSPYAFTGRTWQVLDSEGAQYFGWTTNGRCNYSGNLTNFKFYDRDTLQDLGIYFSSEVETSSVVRYGTAGEVITVSPFDFGADMPVIDLSATNAAGRAVALQGVTDNGDGSWSFIMPDEAVTVRPEYTFPGYSKLTVSEDSADAVQMNLSNAFYVVSFDYGSVGYILNSIPTDDSISMSFMTNSVTETVDINGLVRWRGQSDPYYAYVGNIWYTISDSSGNTKTGEVFNRTGERTEIIYDAQAHSFSAEVGGQSVPLSQHPAGNYSGGSLASIDADGATKMGLSWNSGTYTAALTEFRMTDSQGWDLGVEFSPYNRGMGTFAADMYAEAGGTVTLRKTDENDDIKNFVFTDELGETVDVDVTDNGDGSYTFTMPLRDVTLSVAYYEEPDLFYGSYYCEEDGSMLVFGADRSFLSQGGTVTEILSADFDSLGGITLIFSGGEREASYRALSVSLDGKIYTKLKSYLVAFDLRGGTGDAETQRINSGDYLARKPADPVREGYVFAGWKTSSGEEFDFSAPVSSSVTLYAQWEPASQSGGCAGTLAAGTLPLAAVAAAVACAAVMLRRKAK